MSATETWYASPDTKDTRTIIRFSRVAAGAREVLEMLRDAEQIITDRASQPDPTTKQLVIFVEEPGKLFADETHGLLLRARAQSLARRASRRSGVRMELRW